MEVKNKIKYIELSKLNVLENNPRTISKENFDKLKASNQLSISELGFYKESDGSYTLGKVAE